MSEEAGQVAAEPWPSSALPRATTVNGYRIERILGSGGFGITYLASDLLGQHFAIKEYYPRQFAARRDMTVQPNTAEDVELFDECKDRFMREAHALVRLGRIAGAADGIVRVQTYFEAFGTGFLVMDYVEGESLAAVLHREPGGLPPDRVRSLLVQLLTSVRVVHKAGLVHRDIKPANIILRRNERLVLIDFGATRHATPSETTSYTQIYSGGYGPPEQMLGLRQGEFSDIYAIGAVCYRAIGGSVVNALARQNSLASGRSDPLAPALEIGAGRYPRPLLTLIDAALAVDPAQRPQSVDAMLASLAPEDAAPPATSPQRARTAKPPPRRYGPIAAVGAAIMVLAGAAYLLTPRSGPPPAVVQTPAPEVRTIDKSPAEANQVAPVPPARAPEPQQDAIATPPAPVPSPAPSVSPLEQAKSLAASVPCAALHIAAGSDSVRVSGFAAPGQELARLLAGLHESGRVIDAVARVDRLACAPLSVVGPSVQRGWDGGSSPVALRLEPDSVAAGGRLAISIISRQPVLYLDLYQPDGSVRHLLRPTQAGATPRKTVEWTGTPPAGPRLLVAMAADSALALGARPDTEQASDYLDVLRSRLIMAPAVQSDVATLIVRPAEAVVIKPPVPRQNNVRSERCINIIARAQLGETLSNAELTALQSECRS
jgi:serine/threonine protein kinase